MKLNEKGKELYGIWEQNYYKENDKLGGNSADGDFIEGWSIIDNKDYIKNITDECGLLIFGCYVSIATKSTFDGRIGGRNYVGSKYSC